MKSHSAANGPLPQGIIEVCLCHHARKTARAVTRMFDEALAPSGLNANQFNILIAISATQDASAGRVARKLAMDRTTLSRNLKPLRRADLIITGGGSGRRPDALLLTETGEATLEKAIIHWQQAQTRMSKALGTGHAGQLLTLMANAAEVAK